MAKRAYYIESELVASLKRNERDAFYYLYDHYSPTLYGMICQIIKDEQEADNAMEETFLKIWKNMGSYTPETGSLCIWMLNIARKTAIDTLSTDKNEHRQHKGI